MVPSSAASTAAAASVNMPAGGMLGYKNISPVVKQRLTAFHVGIGGSGFLSFIVSHSYDNVSKCYDKCRSQNICKGNRIYAPPSGHLTA